MISNWGVGGAFVLLFHTFLTLLEKVCVQAYMRATTLPAHICFELQWKSPYSSLALVFFLSLIDQSLTFFLFLLVSYIAESGAVRVSKVSHDFVYKPYALHEKIPWWRRCLYVTSGSLRSLYSTQELAGVSVAALNFHQRI
ncbi:hypothetical protein Bca4012_026251 [Brassica carinata]